jgi:TonB family protein
LSWNEATVRFTVSRDGLVSGATIIKSTGSKEFDQEALRATEGAKLGPLPEGAPANVTCEFTFNYNYTTHVKLDDRSNERGSSPGEAPAGPPSRYVFLRSITWGFAVICSFAIMFCLTMSFFITCVWLLFQKLRLWLTGLIGRRPAKEAGEESQQ